MNSFIKYMLYPRRCDICGDVVAINEPICLACKDNVRIEGNICFKCGKVKKDCNCKNAHHKPEYYAVVAPFVYDKNIPNAIHQLKFYGKQELANSMSKQIASTVLDRYNDAHFDYVTCVPMTVSRTYKRGYNQSKLLAKSVAKELGVPYKQLIRKIFNNPPQRTLSAKLRRGNVFGVYDILDESAVLDKSILLIDDVKTTGATLNACSYVMKIYGAKSVYCATFAIR